jgi:hypothetical protein
VAVVPADPLELNRMLFAQTQQVLPQIDILGWTFVALDPAFGFPAAGPALCNAVDDILRIAEQGDVAGFFEGLKAANRRGQFHAVIRCISVSPGEFLPVLTIQEDDAVSAWAWIR